jgi:TIR domain-containing protein
MASVFISYSHTDREFVRRLAQDLTNQTIEVWLDEWRMAVGKDIKAVLDEGIASYDFFLIVVSRGSIASGWVRHELEIALEKERNGRSGLVLALLLERVPLPPLVGDRSPVDFTQDYAAGLTALIGTLGHVTVKTEVDSARLRIITARRGIKTRSGVMPVDQAEAFTFGSGSSHRLSATADAGGTP